MAGAAEGIIDLYSRRALDWDRDRGKTLIERGWLDAFLAHVPPGGAVLDLGCGSGEPIGRYLIGQGRRLTGVDAAPGLIDLCRRRFPGEDWRLADMRRLALGRRFHGVVAWHSAFHLTPADQREMFAVYARHVAPGGVLMFTSGSEEGETVGSGEENRCITAVCRPGSTGRDSMRPGSSCWRTAAATRRRAARPCGWRVL